jgi:hypothetical protein
VAGDADCCWGTIAAAWCFSGVPGGEKMGIISNYSVTNWPADWQTADKEQI